MQATRRNAGHKTEGSRHVIDAPLAIEKCTAAAERGHGNAPRGCDDPGVGSYPARSDRPRRRRRIDAIAQNDVEMISDARRESESATKPQQIHDDGQKVFRCCS